MTLAAWSPLRQLRVDAGIILIISSFRGWKFQPGIWKISIRGKEETKCVWTIRIVPNIGQKVSFLGSTEVKLYLPKFVQSSMMKSYFDCTISEERKKFRTVCKYFPKSWIKIF